MQFLDLKTQYQSIKKEIDQAIKNVLDNCNFILGPEVKKLEKNVAKYCGTKYGIALNSGTDALLLSLKGLGIGPGDEVIVPSFTFIATPETIVNVGAKPIFIDINPETFNLDVNKIEKLITKKTKAIIPVHLFGQPAEMDKIIKIAKKHKLRVIEDAAQAIGAKHKNKKMCSIGDCGCLSFFPSKNLGGYGDGGMVVTNNKNLAKKITLLRAHGATKKYHYQIIGTSSRLDALQSAVLSVKLKYLNKWTKARQKNANYYNQQFKNIKEIKTPQISNNCVSVFNQYTIRAKNRNQLQKYLKQNNIPTQIYYPSPLHLQPAFKYLGYKKGDLPETEKACKEVMSIPIYAELKNKNQDHVIQKIKKFYEI